MVSWLAIRWLREGKISKIWTIYYPDKRPQAVWGSERITYDHVDDVDDDDNDEIHPNSTVGIGHHTK